MQTLLQDLRFAARQVRKNPGFAITTILTLALGIGTTTAIFSLVNAVLLRPLPYPQPDRLVFVGTTRNVAEDQKGDNGVATISLSYPDYFDYRQQNHSLQAMASYHDNQFILTGRGEAQHVEGEIVGADFFRTLGIHPAMGRDFFAEDEKPGVRVVMLSQELWRTSFGSDASIVGKTINLDGYGYQVAGVMPAGFNFPAHTPSAQLWTTLADDAFDPLGQEPMTAQRGAHMLDVVGRLKPSVAAEQAQADFSLIAKNLSAAFPKSNKRFTGAIVESELEHMVGNTRPALRILFGAVLFVLLIACANVAGLLLARASRRRSEIAVRSALGATRFQIIRQIMVESVFLGVCGGLAGVTFSVGLLRVVARFVPEYLPRFEQVNTDFRVLLFAIAVSVGTGLLFGVLPAVRISRLDPSASLREGTRTASAGRNQHRVQGALVVIETAIGLLLLVGSGLLIRSFTRIMHVDPGFETRHVLITSLDLPDTRYPGDKNVQFYGTLLPRLAAMPGVQAVSAGWPMPLTGRMMTIGFDIEGRPNAPGENPAELVSVAEPGFFKTLGIPVIEGREFTETDTRNSPLVVVVTQNFAHKYFPNESPIGKHMRPGIGDGYTQSNRMREIVGVVGDIKRSRLTANYRPEYYLPHSQATVSSPALVLRTSGDPANLIASVRSEVAALDRNIPVYDMLTYDDLMSRNAAEPRFQSMLLTFFAAIALLLSAVGLYGVLSYMVTQRTTEIGVRMALGARRSDVLNLVLRRGAGLALLGLAIGMGLSVGLTRYLASLLYTIKPLDPVTLLSVTAILLFVALLASTAPAWRAARLDPMKTLRDQ